MPKRSASVTVYINVTNVDEPLTIDRPLTVGIPENHGTVKQVTNVNAGDPENAPVTYSILGASPFSIDPSTGVIIVTGTIDREAPVHSYVATEY